VYSSFKIYGWDQRDKDFETLFKAIDDHPQMTNHGSVPNAEVREALKKAHIFAYPSTWAETSCMSLMEAMSAKCICVHSNFGALYETASHWTNQYQYYEQPNSHAGALYNMLDLTIEHYKAMYQNTGPTKVYADTFYSWENREAEWNSLMGALIGNVEDRSIPKDEGPMFSYSTG
jgi:glycosyltransferase involved in cell wall biosynthesis